MRTFTVAVIFFGDIANGKFDAHGSEIRTFSNELFGHGSAAQAVSFMTWSQDLDIFVFFAWDPGAYCMRTRFDDWRSVRPFVLCSVTDSGSEHAFSVHITSRQQLATNFPVGSNAAGSVLSMSPAARWRHLRPMSAAWRRYLTAMSAACLTALSAFLYLSTLPPRIEISTAPERSMRAVVVEGNFHGPGDVPTSHGAEGATTD